jgi:hypothetical protein
MFMEEPKSPKGAEIPSERDSENREPEKALSTRELCDRFKIVYGAHEP